MAQEIEIKTPCGGCGETGLQPLHPSGSISCFMCSGTGKQTIGVITLSVGFDDVMDKLDDVMDKLDDILEAINE